MIPWLTNGTLAIWQPIIYIVDKTRLSSLYPAPCDLFILMMPGQHHPIKPAASHYLTRGNIWMMLLLNHLSSTSSSWIAFQKDTRPLTWRPRVVNYRVTGPR